MRFPTRDFTEQYISSSYQDVLQQYTPSDVFYLLDGYGNVIFSLPSSSIGQMLIASNMTSSMTVATTSYAMLSDTSSFSLLAESSVTSTSASHSKNADNADFSLASYMTTGIQYSDIKIKNTSYIVTLQDQILIATGSIPIIFTLPSSSLSSGKLFIFKNRNDNPMYITTSDNSTIDDSLSITASFKNTSIHLQCSGSEWFII